MLLFPLLFAATLAAAFAVTLSHVAVVDVVSVCVFGSTHAVAAFFRMAIDRGPWPTACPNANCGLRFCMWACQLGSKVHGALLSRRSIL